MVDTVKQRKPNFATRNSGPSGRLKRDERGNAVWDWNGEREELHGNFDHLGLEIQDSAPGPGGPGGSPQNAAENLYQADRSGVDKPRKPRDLRALSRVIAEQRKRGKDKR